MASSVKLLKVGLKSLVFTTAFITVYTVQYIINILIRCSVQGDYEPLAIYHCYSFLLTNTCWCTEECCGVRSSSRRQFPVIRFKGAPRQLMTKLTVVQLSLLVTRLVTVAGTELRFNFSNISVIITQIAKSNKCRYLRTVLNLTLTVRYYKLVACSKVLVSQPEVTRRPANT